MARQCKANTVSKFDSFSDLSHVKRSGVTVAKVGVITGFLCGLLGGLLCSLNLGAHEHEHARRLFRGWA